MRRLFDSIWRGFPIGNLLLWSSQADAATVKYGPLVVEAEATENALWVVDGQQRVTTLVGALAPAAGLHDPKFEICFDLRRSRFVHAGKKPMPAWWLPLRVTLESRLVVAWAREYGDELSAEEFDLADQVGGALRDYKIQAYVVEDADEDLLRDIFDRVNSAGKPISRAQVFHALFGGVSDVASTSAIQESLEREGFGEIDDQRVVQSLLAIRGGNISRDLHAEFDPNEDRERWFDDTERALLGVVGFLRRQGVPHLHLMPSTFPVPVLAAFFHLHPEADPWTEQLLARWLWRGWVHGYGRSGQTPALRQAIRAVNPVKGAPEKAPSEYDAVVALLDGVPDEPAPLAQLRGFQTNSAPGKLALLALANLAPRQITGEVIDLAREFERHGIRAVTELVPGHRTDLPARGFWLQEDPLPDGSEDPSVLESHGIDASAAGALRHGDVDAFLVARGDAVEREITGFLARRLEQGVRPRPPIAQLFVPEDDEA